MIEGWPFVVDFRWAMCKGDSVIVGARLLQLIIEGFIPAFAVQEGLFRAILVSWLDSSPHPLINFTEIWPSIAFLLRKYKPTSKKYFKGTNPRKNYTLLGVRVIKFGALALHGDVVIRNLIPNDGQVRIMLGNAFLHWVRESYIFGNELDIFLHRDECTRHANHNPGSTQRKRYVNWDLGLSFLSFSISKYNLMQSICLCFAGLVDSVPKPKIFY